MCKSFVSSICNDLKVSGNVPALTRLSLKKTLTKARKRGDLKVSDPQLVYMEHDFGGLNKRSPSSIMVEKWFVGQVGLEPTSTSSRTTAEHQSGRASRAWALERNLHLVGGRKYW